MLLPLLSLFLAAFSIGTTEFVIAGLLPDISRDLGVSIPSAGLLVTGYAIGVAIGGPILSLLTSRFPRKPTIVSLMVIFVVGHVLCAIAPNYLLLMAARIVVSFSHGSFFGLAAIISVSLVPPERRGFALSLVFAGISVANIVGVPLGTFIGNALGWRATFWVVGSVAIFAGLAMFVFLPRDAAQQRQGATIADQFRVLGHPQVYMTYAIIVLAMIGFFSFFTFIAPFLVEVTHIQPPYVPALLLLFGLGATIGILVGGRLGDWRPVQTLLFTFPVQTLVYSSVLLFAPNPYAMTFLLFAVGASVMVVNATLQGRILGGAAAAPDLASTLISSVFNIGIAIGAWLGATLLTQGAPYASLPWLGVIMSVLVSLLVIVAIRIDNRRPVTVAPAT